MLYIALHGENMFMNLYGDCIFLLSVYKVNIFHSCIVVFFFTKKKMIKIYDRVVNFFVVKKITNKSL